MGIVAFAGKILTPLTGAIRFGICLWLIFIKLLPLFSQQPFQFNNIDLNQGLSSRTINTIEKDKYGFMWIGTSYGLNRYDGNDFKHFFNEVGHAESLSGNRISQICQDSQGNLWVGTLSKGLNRYVFETETFERIIIDTLGNSQKTITILYEDSRQQLWIGTASQDLYIMDISSKHIRKISAGKGPNLLLGGHVEAIHEMENGMIWIGSEGGIDVYDSEKQKLRKDISQGLKSTSHEWIKDIYVDANGIIWVGTYSGLNYWDEALQSFNSLFPEPARSIDPNNYILDIQEDTDGKLWIGTDGGAFILNTNTFEFTPITYNQRDPFSISQGSVNTIFSDPGGILWLGTENALSLTGVYSLTHHRFSRYFKEGEEIRGIAYSGDSLWVAMKNGLFIHHPSSGFKKFYEGEFFAVHIDQQKDIYAGMANEEGFIHIHRSSQKVDRYPADEKNADLPSGAYFAALANDHHGNIWLGTWNGANRFNPKTKSFSVFRKDPQNPHAISGHGIGSIFCDSKGNIWIGTVRGLNMVPAEDTNKKKAEDIHFKSYTFRENDTSSLSDDRVFCIGEDYLGYIWVGTENGLNRLDPQTGRFDRFFITQGLPSNKISSLIYNDDKKLWVSTSNAGIFTLDVDDFSITHYTIDDGLFDNAFILNAITTDDQQRIIAASYRGLVHISPVLGKDDHTSIPFYITRMEANERLLDETGKKEVPPFLIDQLSLHHKQNNLSFLFTPLAYGKGKRSAFQYQLEGLEDQWYSFEGQKELVFNHLAPGHYKLNIRPLETEKIEEGIYLSLDISPPWYRSSLAYICYGLLFIGLIYLIYTTQLKRSLAQNEAIKLKEIDDAKTRFFTNISHEFRTPLTIIIGMVEKIHQDPIRWQENGLMMIRRNSKKLLSLINQILDLSKLESGAMEMNKVHGNIIVLLKYMLESYESFADVNQNNLHFLVNEKEIMMDFDPDKIQHIISNLLSNAIKYTPAGGDIYFQLEKIGNEFLQLKVKDTGKGISEENLQHVFDRFYSAESSEIQEGTGVGLALTKELIELMGGQISVQSELNKGSEFTILLPIEDHHTASPFLPPSIEAEETVALIPQRPDAPTSHSESRELVLVVEDNPDVSSLIYYCLEEVYELEIAKDGQEGINKAMELIPDLIISDVMMPNKDGYELCQALKSHPLTNHIPIILLSAKADTPSMISGLDLGADDYIPKPFQEEMLKAKIKGLLKNRKKLQMIYGSQNFAEKGTEANEKEQNISREEAFILSFKASIMDHMEDPELDVSKICKLMGMGRTQLHNKLKAITGKSTTQYVNSIKLGYAARLLLETESNISEIAYQTGFNNIQYFSKSFSKIYGMSPSAYRVSNA